MVNLTHDLYLIMLDEHYISYDQYVRAVPDYAIPDEYRTASGFYKAKQNISGKASRTRH